MHFFKWMDGWPAMETDAGRVVMNTPATSSITFVYSGAADASGNHTLYFQGCQQSLGNEVLEVNCMPWTQLTRIVLISITYQSHRASKHSAAGKEVVRT